MAELGTHIPVPQPDFDPDLEVDPTYLRALEEAVAGPSYRSWNVPVGMIGGLFLKV